jgi:hypothetical protein
MGRFGGPERYQTLPGRKNASEHGVIDRVSSSVQANTI